MKSFASGNLGTKLLRELALDYRLDYGLPTRADFLSKLGSKSRHSRILYSSLCSAFAVVLILAIWGTGSAMQNGQLDSSRSYAPHVRKFDVAHASPAPNPTAVSTGQQSDSDSNDKAAARAPVQAAVEATATTNSQQQEATSHEAATAATSQASEASTQKTATESSKGTLADSSQAQTASNSSAQQQEEEDPYADPAEAWTDEMAAEAKAQEKQYEDAAQDPAAVAAADNNSGDVPAKAQHAAVAAAPVQPDSTATQAAANQDGAELKQQDGAASNVTAAAGR